ncbi:hypothetical protein G7Z17_g835 [Cylindrodendrum hubeiense]|uniref:Glutathione S-transferase n=1 Tax=Cylindrodendrum hubeiense TaxID=595255 RepID=A0A9P5HP12_9HYPO|nr:hypothetical protein G7Z17_g835 [Cylindrodendrum hubeiense]
MALIVHHLHVSQSERIPWLCEELGIDYELKTYKRVPILAPPEYKALHPLGTAPIIQDGELTLAESCACIEYICHKYGQGRLFLPSTHPAYAEFLYWWHWADGSFQPALLQAMVMAKGGPINDSPIAKISKDSLNRGLRALDDRLRVNKWLIGDEFTVVDVMIVFSLTTMRYYYPYSLTEYPNTFKYLQRIGEREAYQKAMKRCDPEMELALWSDPPTKVPVASK